MAEAAGRNRRASREPWEACWPSYCSLPASLLRASRPSLGRTARKWTARSSPLRTLCGGPRSASSGPTLSFHYINDSHRTVNELKQKYGNAYRIVHRGKTWGSHGALLGYGDIYTLILEVPVKCPKFKETFSIDDFGLADCPGMLG